MITTKDVYGQEHSVDPSKLQWRPAAYGIVIKDDKVLLLPSFEGKHALPGGRVEVYEKIEEAVIREIKEETGLHAKLVKLIDIRQSFFSSVHDKAATEHYNSILFYYLCEYVSGEISTDGFDEEEIHYAKAAEWIPLEKLGSLELASTVDFRPLIQQAMKEKNNGD